MRFGIDTLALALLVTLAPVLVGCSDDEGGSVPMIELDPPMEVDTTDPGNNQSGPRFYESTNYIVADIGMRVYVPSDYDEARSYPVLYLNDGDLMAEVWGRLTVLEAEPFILVGLNTEYARHERFMPYVDEYLLGVHGEYEPRAEEYSAQIVNEVIPFVKEHYNVRKPGIMGISLGALHAAWIAIRYPHTFSFAGSLSASFQMANRALLSEPFEPLRPQGLSRPVKFYYDRGTSEWRNFQPFINQLKQVDLQYGNSIFYYEVLGADHEIFDWINRVEVPFRIFLEGTRNAELIDFEVKAYCLEDLDEGGKLQGRINPLVSFDNGVIYSVMTESQMEVIEGDGSVTQDGSYVINRGTSMVVAVQYGDFTERVEVQKCH